MTEVFSDSLIAVQAGWSPECAVMRLGKEKSVRISHQTLYRRLREDGGGFSPFIKRYIVAAALSSGAGAFQPHPYCQTCNEGSTTDQ